MRHARIYAEGVNIVKTVLPLVFCAMLANTTACPVTPGENLGLTLGTSFSFARLVVKFH